MLHAALILERELPYLRIWSSMSAGVFTLAATLTAYTSEFKAFLSIATSVTFRRASLRTFKLDDLLSFSAFCALRSGLAAKMARVLGSFAQLDIRVLC